MKRTALPGSWVLAAAAFLPVAAFLISFPLLRPWLPLGFVVYAGVLIRFPRAWLIVVPAAMSVFDLALFSGWFFFDEFDALVLLTVAILYWRQPFRRGDIRLGYPLAITVILLCASYVISTAIVLYPWPTIDGNSFASYYSPFNALRVAKGFLWPLLLLPHLAMSIRTDQDTGKLLAAGLLLGLLAMCLVALYERWLFVGLLNFGHGYRVTGPFSSLHTGGGDIDLWLATTIPLISVVLVYRWPTLLRMAALLLAAFALYILLATASRGPFLATAAALFIVFGAFLVQWVRQGKIGRTMLLYPMLAAWFGLLVVPFVVQTQLGDRFNLFQRDLNIRLTDFRNALAMRDPGLFTHIAGMGLGMFPRTYNNRQRGAYPVGSYSFDGPAGHRYLTLRPGENLYFGQKVDVRPYTPYLLSFIYRTHEKVAGLTAAICEKWLLESMRCSWNAYKLKPTNGRWVAHTAVVKMGKVGAPLGRIGALSSRPIRMALFPSGARDGLSIDDIALTTKDGRNLIRNGDFSDNNDFWFWTVDNHRPWHIFNMMVNILFDQGWVGLVAILSLTILSFIALCRGFWAQRSDAIPWLGALTGYLLTGLVVSAFDQPRLAMLFYLVCFYVCLRFGGSSFERSEPETR